MCGRCQPCDRLNGTTHRREACFVRRWSSHLPWVVPSSMCETWQCRESFSLVGLSASSVQLHEISVAAAREFCLCALTCLEPVSVHPLGLQAEVDFEEPRVQRPPCRLVQWNLWQPWSHRSPHCPIGVGSTVGRCTPPSQSTNISFGVGSDLHLFAPFLVCKVLKSTLSRPTDSQIHPEPSE